MQTRTSSAQKLALFSWWLLLGVLALMLPNLPAPLPAAAPAPQFSAERAMRIVRAIAQEPHPVGSPANAAVRDFLLAELEALGLEPQVQRTVAAAPWGGTAAVVENIVARVPGSGGETARRKAILLVGHYDSVPTGPGASDDGSAVATLLETARALQAGPPLRNDVILLFSDAEEIGLVGAAGFAAEHPWMQDVGLVLNFEARGHTGPVYTFETSLGNGWLIPEFARAVPYPSANSLMYEIYQLLPNDTDFTVFKRAGLAGFNFGFIGGSTYYHSVLDNPEHINPASLQHDGSYALSLTRHFGSLDLNRPPEPDQVYFDLFGAFLVYYPAMWALPLAALAAVLYVVLLVVGMRRGQVRLSWVGWGALALLINVVLAGGGAWLGWALITRIYPWYAWMGEFYNSGLYWGAFLALALALLGGLYRLWRRRGKPDELVAGAAFWWMLLAVALGTWLRGGAFIFTWPLLFMLAGLGTLWLLKVEPGSWRWVLVIGLSSAPAVIFLMPLVYAIYIGLSSQALFAPVALFALLLSLLLPFVMDRRSWMLPAAALLVAVGLLIAGSLTSGFSPQQPEKTTILYGLNADQQQAYWIGFADPGLWTDQFLVDPYPAQAVSFFPYSQGMLPVSPAPVVDLPGPEVQVLEDRIEGDARTLRLHLRSPRRAPVLYLYLMSDQEVVETTVEGHSLGDSYSFDFWALPPEGIETTLHLHGTGPVALQVIDQTFGLPQLPGFTYQPRPADQIPATTSRNEVLLVSRAISIP